MLELRVDRLHRLRTPSVALPYIFQAVGSAVDGEAEAPDVASCLDVVESFLVRRAIMGIEPTGLHAVFKGLWNAAGADPSRIAPKLTTATVTFPSDKQLHSYILNERLYGRTIAFYVIWEFETANKLGDVHPQPPEGTQVDHVMPQGLKDEEVEKWDGWDIENYRRLRHTWGNLVPLTATGNQQKAKRSWEKTRELLDANTIFKSTARVLAEHDTWTRADVLSRSQHLAEFAKERWPNDLPA